jgi:hypothetical protein
MTTAACASGFAPVGASGTTRPSATRARARVGIGLLSTRADDPERPTSGIASTRATAAGTGAKDLATVVELAECIGIAARDSLDEFHIVRLIGHYDLGAQRG